MTSDERPEKFRFPWIIVIVVGLLPLLYVLSIGPAWSLCGEPWFPLERQTVAEIYQPLINFCETTGTLDALNRYVTLWFGLVSD